MDSSSTSSRSFDPNLARTIEEEKQKAMLAELITKITSSCWDKCITGTPGSKFSSSEASCLSNCAQRYLDMNILLIKRFQSMNRL
ncbi:unnamed protein product [Cuscuta campestris]|uniref:Mitochondrial import inner membrane translocase subunit n=2 Tax=Cuscuta sect. Cleistogrammica TaxID=1824901 RepID=A0A484MWI2_9ASTE|nr:hypothetical protein DM860_008886 [Cuscuta australis]VFQ92869.1 unnamed protein product [Cuscuta campestris]